MADNTSHPLLFDINLMLPSKPIEDKILACNSTTEAYGLTLTQKQAGVTTAITRLFSVRLCR